MALTIRFTLAATALLLPEVALAQPAPPDQPPPRIGNVWNNQSHQPDRGQVGQQEKQAGLRGTPAGQQARRDEMDRLNAEILQRAQQTHDGVMSGKAATEPTP